VAVKRLGGMVVLVVLLDSDEGRRVICGQAERNATDRLKERGYYLET